MTTSFLIFIFSMVVSVGIMVFLAWLYGRRRDSLRVIPRVSPEYHPIENNVSELLEAKKDARKIVQEAGQEAEEILSNTREITSRMSEELHVTLEGFVKEETSRLREASTRLISEYNSLSEEARGTYERALEGVSHSVASEAGKGIVQFQDFVQKEMSRYERLTDHNLEEWRKTFEGEIEKQKKEAVKKIEDSIYRILFFVSKEVLGKVIDLDLHQDLVLRALDEAKKEGFFEASNQ